MIALCMGVGIGIVVILPIVKSLNEKISDLKSRVDELNRDARLLNFRIDALQACLEVHIKRTKTDQSISEVSTYTVSGGAGAGGSGGKQMPVVLTIGGDKECGTLRLRCSGVNSQTGNVSFTLQHESNGTKSSSAEETHTGYTFPTWTT